MLRQVIPTWYRPKLQHKSMKAGHSCILRAGRGTRKQDSAQETQGWSDYWLGLSLPHALSPKSPMYVPQYFPLPM